jgi:hypothetical protein
MSDEQEVIDQTLQMPEKLIKIEAVDKKELIAIDMEQVGAILSMTTEVVCNGETAEIEGIAIKQVKDPKSIIIPGAPIPSKLIVVLKLKWNKIGGITVVEGRLTN